MSLENNNDSNDKVTDTELKDGHFLTDEEKKIVAEENINVVFHVAKSFGNTFLDNEELISIALLGYAKAIQTYRIDKNTKFSTYAINCCKNEILYMLKKEKKHVVNDVSLSKTVSTDKNGNNLQLEDILQNKADSSSKGLEVDIINNEKNHRILAIMNRELTERERYVICHRFELNGYKLKTQSQIAEEMNMSQANISKIEKNVLKKLKRYIDKSDLGEF